MPNPCTFCGKREASSGASCPTCHHAVGTEVCVECHVMLNHTPAPTDLLEKAQAGRDEDGLKIHGDSNGR